MSMYAEDQFPYVLAVTLINGQLIGHVGLSAIKQGVEIGYGIGEAYQYQGYATEAVCSYVRWGKEHFNLDKVYGLVKHGNVASCRVLEKAGFKSFGEDTDREFDKEHLRLIYAV